MFHIWPRAVSARAMRHVAVDAVSVGQSEVVAHGIPEADLVQLEFRLKLDEISFRDAACHHFRLPNTHRIHGGMSRCPCGARPDGDHSAPSFGEHVLGCMQCSKGLGVGNPRLIRHNFML